MTTADRKKLETIIIKIENLQRTSKAAQSNWELEDALRVAKDRLMRCL